MMSRCRSAESNSGATGNAEMWSEETLVAVAKKGQKSAFEELYERNANQIFRVTYRITRNREDADDAMQECFLNAFVHLKAFDGRSQFAAWLTRIAINAALMKLRKNHGVREVPMDELNPSFEPMAQREFRDDAPDSEESCSARERREILNTAILGLRPRARRVVGAPPIARTLTQRNRTDSGDLDHGSKNSDVSRESCPESNAPAADLVQSAERQVDREASQWQQQ